MATRSSRSASNPRVAGVRPLSAFRATAGALSMAQRRTLVEQALHLIDGCYVHLPLKRAMHAVDPVQRLRLLAQRLPTLSEPQFHDELLDIFTDLRDLHTNYVLPGAYQQTTAFLPFLVEEYTYRGRPRYLVTKLFQGFQHEHFVPGVVVTSWNGVPLDRAVELNADRQAGSNVDARRARGIEAMTVRWLGMTAPPDEDWVIVGFDDVSGTAREVRMDWQVFEPDRSPNGTDPGDAGSEAARRLGIDARTEAVRRAKKALFNPKAMDLEADAAARAAQAARSAARGGRRGAARAAPAPRGDTSTMPDVFSFRTVDTPSGRYGYIRIWTFDVDDADTFVDEFVRIASLVPQDGLILDVRGNGGGLITAAEQLLQVLTPNTVEPSRLSFRSTPLTVELCRTQPWLRMWLGSLERSVETGELYSQALPLDPPEESNRRGQRYQGPVVLVTDALCYSATDIFAAGFQDNRVGPVLGVSGNTGAGGANVWDHGLLRQLLPDGPFTALPRSSSFRVSIRRITRAGVNAGTPLEDLGVVPDQRHAMTKADLLESNRDLVAKAGALLKRQPLARLDARVTDRTDDAVTLEVKGRGIDRVDVYVGGRPMATADVRGTTAVTLPPVTGEARLAGFKRGVLRVVAHLDL